MSDLSAAVFVVASQMYVPEAQAASLVFQKRRVSTTRLRREEGEKLSVGVAQALSRTIW